MRADGISPLMIEGIYTMLLLLWITLGVVGFISVGNWVDEKIDAMVRRREMRRTNERMGDILRAKVAELNQEGLSS